MKKQRPRTGMGGQESAVSFSRSDVVPVSSHISQAVESVLEAAITAASAGGARRVSHESLSLGTQPPELRMSIVSMQDVAQRLLLELVEMRECLAAMQQRRRQASSEDDMVTEALDDLDRAVDFVQQGRSPGEWDRGVDFRVHRQPGKCRLIVPRARAGITSFEQQQGGDGFASRIVEPATRGGGGGDVLSFAELDRLSFVVLASDRLAAFAGGCIFCATPGWKLILATPFFCRPLRLYFGHPAMLGYGGV